MFTAVNAVPADVKIQGQLTALHIEAWLKEDVFQFRWWCLLAFLAVFLIVWWKMADKSRLPEIMLYVALAVIFVLGIVEYGEELCLWDYPTDIIPIFPPLTSINLISIPLIYSLVYQHFGTLKSFIRAVLISTAVISFVFEPMLSKGGFFLLLKWKFYFSCPVYVLMAIIVRASVLKINAINKKYKIKPGNH